MNSIFEVVDTTDDDVYYTIGVFLTFEQAKAELDECEDPSDLSSPVEHSEIGGCEVEIRERELGWNDKFKVRLTKKWVSEFDDELDECIWKLQ